MKNSNRLNIFILLILTIPIIMSFSPIISYFLSILLLIFKKYSNYKTIRFFLIINGFLSLFIIYFSRDFKSEIKHDLFHYFNEYTKIVQGNYTDFNIFGNGLEVGYHYLYILLNYISPEFNEIQLAGVNLLICILLFIIWIELYISKRKFLLDDIGIIYGLAILFLGFVSFGYLQRQSLSIALLLFAISTRNIITFFIFFILSTAFHTTSLPLILIYKILQKIEINSLKKLYTLLFIIVIIGIFFRIGFYSYVEQIINSGVNLKVFHKLNFYKEPNFSILSYKDILINLCILLGTLVYWKNIDRNWRNIILFSMIVYFIFIGIPLLSERINFILFYLYGLFIYLFSIHI